MDLSLFTAFCGNIPCILPSAYYYRILYIADKVGRFNSPVFIGLQNYIDMFQNGAFRISLRNIILWSIIAGTLHVGFGVLVAFVLYHRPKGWKFTRAVFMIPNVISAAAWAMIYKFIFNDEMGVLNNIIRKINPDFHVQWFLNHHMRSGQLLLPAVLCSHRYIDRFK